MVVAVLAMIGASVVVCVGLLGWHSVAGRRFEQGLRNEWVGGGAVPASREVLMD